MQMLTAASWGQGAGRDTRRALGHPLHPSPAYWTPLASLGELSLLKHWALLSSRSSPRGLWDVSDSLLFAQWASPSSPSLPGIACLAPTVQALPLLLWVKTLFFLLLLLLPTLSQQQNPVAISSCY